MLHTKVSGSAGWSGLSAKHPLRMVTTVDTCLVQSKYCTNALVRLWMCSEVVVVVRALLQDATSCEPHLSTRDIGAQNLKNSALSQDFSGEM
jgi:hypothetical protein